MIFFNKVSGGILWVNMHFSLIIQVPNKVVISNTLSLFFIFNKFRPYAQSIPSPVQISYVSPNLEFIPFERRLKTLKERPICLPHLLIALIPKLFQ